MNLASNSQGGVQLGLWESIMDLLMIKPVFFLGIFVVIVLLLILGKNKSAVSKVRIILVSFILYYYLYLLFGNIVGVPTLSELFRLSRLKEAVFNPNINLIPFSDGLSLSFILNIVLFVPLGFLCPILSRTYQSAKADILSGFFLSLFIEISQLFTLYRATDINDLITNILGTAVGYLCFNLIVKLKVVKRIDNKRSVEKDSLAYMPLFIMIISFGCVFFS